MQLHFLLELLRVESSRLADPCDDHLAVDGLLISRIYRDDIRLRIKSERVIRHRDHKILVAVILIYFREIFAVV